jgi:anhydro-N-acetylmuramic acid kinase
VKVIGLMSGTSLDGVDAACIETDGITVTHQGPSLTLPYALSLRDDLRRLLDLAPTILPADPFLLDVTARVTSHHIAATRALATPADLIGMHGQTILHRPAQHRTWQIGDAAALADATGLPIAHDFRSADVAAGGQGAPLAPIYHAALTAGLERPLAILNIGGVANVTWIGPDDTMTAFDTGPGCGPLDDWARRTTTLDCDRDGALSAGGQVHPPTLAQLLAYPYFAAPPPKSLDRLDFSAALAAGGLGGLTPADGAATLVAFTVGAVVASLAYLPAPPLRWLVCGGGRHNPSIMAGLRRALAVPVENVDTHGWQGDALEAQCFAFLAARTLHGLPISFPGTTGAPKPLAGGRITSPARQD